jgi:hypothetical protein
MLVQTHPSCPLPATEPSGPFQPSRRPDCFEYHGARAEWGEDAEAYLVWLPGWESPMVTTFETVGMVRQRRDSMLIASLHSRPSTRATQFVLPSREAANDFVALLGANGVTHFTRVDHPEYPCSGFWVQHAPEAVLDGLCAHVETLYPNWPPTGGECWKGGGNTFPEPNGRGRFCACCTAEFESAEHPADRLVA